MTRIPGKPLDEEHESLFPDQMQTLVGADRIYSWEASEARGARTYVRSLVVLYVVHAFLAAVLSLATTKLHFLHTPILNFGIARHHLARIILLPLRPRPTPHVDVT